MVIGYVLLFLFTSCCVFLCIAFLFSFIFHLFFFSEILWLARWASVWCSDRVWVVVGLCLLVVHDILLASLWGQNKII